MEQEGSATANHLFRPFFGAFLCDSALRVGSFGRRRRLTRPCHATFIYSTHLYNCSASRARWEPDLMMASYDGVRCPVFSFAFPRAFFFMSKFLPSRNWRVTRHNPLAEQNGWCCSCCWAVPRSRFYGLRWWCGWSQGKLMLLPANGRTIKAQWLSVCWFGFCECVCVCVPFLRPQDKPYSLGSSWKWKIVPVASLLEKGVMRSLGNRGKDIKRKRKLFCFFLILPSLHCTETRLSKWKTAHDPPANKTERNDT